MAKNKIKIPGYAKRIFFNDNIEYRNFSPDLVGFQLTSEGGTTLFTNGNFSISVNLDPKPDILFKQGTKSKFYTLDDIELNNSQEIEKNLKAKLNVDLTNPLSYIWYGSTKEYIRASLLELQYNWPAAIYVDDKVGSVSGNNITDYTYDISSDESTFKVNSKYFVNPYNILYTIDHKFTSTEDNSNPLRNFTINYGSYVIEHNGITKNIKLVSGATQTTNSDIQIVVEGNPFPELTGIFIPQLSFLNSDIDASIPYFIKPNEEEIEKFFSGLDDLQRNILNRNIYPKYTFEYIASKYTDDGVLLTSKELLIFPILEDGYNLNFFDTFYLSYLDNLTELGENLDGSSTDIIVRKYTTEAINSFDTLPKSESDDYTLNGEKATKLLRIYGVEFDEVKKFINGIKFGHVVTYDKKNNVPDVLVKDLAYMLGIDIINFIDDSKFSKLLLPSNGEGEFSGSPKNLTKSEVDVELYRRLILNVAWLWKSKGTRKAIEFLFRFIGAPESLVNFDEYVVMVDKPLEIEELKKLLYLYTGDVNLDNVPYDENGFPLPPINGNLVVTNFIDPETGLLVEDDVTDMYFQKAGGWYRETYGSNVISILDGNNPHIGPYDGGSEYLHYFSKCYIPNFNGEPTVTVSSDTIVQNYFINYNYGIFNGISNDSDIFTTQLTFNSLTGKYQPIDTCIDVNYSIIETPLQNDGKTTFQQQYDKAEKEYNDFLDKIKKDSYLQYSPEWQVIKNNYEIAKNNVNNEVVTVNCDINKTLEICLNELTPITTEYSCDNLTLVECSPFLYYQNSDGLKTSFDEYPTCCENQGGRYVNYENEYGRTTEYCSKLAPCVGEPVQILENGVVVFETKYNIVPDNIYHINENCYQLTDNSSTILESLGLTVQGYIDSLNFKNLDQSFYLIFNQIDCVLKTSVSSPECCAWYGYDYNFIEDNGKKFIVCVTNNTVTSSVELGPTKNTVTGVEIGTTKNILLSTPFIDFNVNNSYYNLQNPIGSVYQYYSTEIFGDCFDESRIVKNVVSSSNIPYNPNSILDDPILMNPSNWEVDTIDGYGRVSFTPKIYDNNFVIDWNSETLLSDLYKNIAEYYNYGFGVFSFDYNNNILIPYVGDNPLTTNPNSTTTAAVDPERIGCDDFNNVSVVFASEKWGGFKLPEDRDCSCTIDFSFDYMLKYNTENLISCAEKQTCFPAFFYDNSFSNINCLNFVSFTTNESDTQLIQNSFNSLDTKEEEYVIWQNTNVIEPNNECCVAIGGNVVNLDEWLNNQTTLLSKTKSFYNEFKILESLTLTGFEDDNILNLLNFNYGPMFDFVQTYKTIKQSIESKLTNCFVVDFTVQPCDIDYKKYITNNNVCSLDLPIECGFWSNILTDYNTLKNGIEGIINQYKSLCGLFDPYETELEVYEGGIEITKEKNTLNEQKDKELNILETEQKELQTTIDSLLNEINTKNSDNIVIQKSTNQIDTSLDCSIYEEKIKEINNFDYDSYCKSNIVNLGDKLNLSEQYNSCKTNKIVENEVLKKNYNQLFNDCNNINTLNSQLTQAKIENNQVLINQIENEILELENNINTITNDVTNDLNSNESLLKSTLEQNDLQNTINVTAKLLDTTPDNITDSSGNLVLTDTQKVDLNIIYLKNQSQISSLKLKQDETQSIYNSNVKKQSEIVKKTLEQDEIFNSLLNTGGNTIPPTPPDRLTVGCTLTGVFTDPNTGNKFNIVSQPADIMCSSWFNECCWILGSGGLYNKGCCVGNLIPDDTSGGGGVGTGGVGIGTETEEVESDGPTQTPGTDIPNPDPGTNIPGPDPKICCDHALILFFQNSLNNVESKIVEIEQHTRTCYDDWFNNVLYNNFVTYEEDNDKKYLNFIDDLKINFKIFVDNNDIEIQNNIDTSLTYLPYTESINPIWEWDPTSGYTGVLLEGDEQQIALVEDAIFSQLSENNITYNSDIFEPNWKTFNFTIPECVCDDLRKLYPNKEFFFSIEVDNYECSVCLLVDNILVNVSDCNIETQITLNDCLIPQLSCVKDNKKSWVYTNGGLLTKTIYPDGECNTGSTTNYSVVKLQTPQERLWANLEYRYTNYDVYHSDLIMNVKNTSFSVDPAKAIECDVFDFWKQIDCDNCPIETGCTISYSGDVFYTGTTTDSYVLDLNIVSTTGLTFSCDTYTDILKSQVIELKNGYYTLTSDYNESLNANYYGLIEKGETLSKFTTQKSNCGGDILVINNNKELDNLFGLIVEESGGTIGFYETYLYSGASIYSGGVLEEVISGVTAQTFNQTITEECCKSLNDVINGEGVDGLGLGKNYGWNSTLSACTWLEVGDSISNNDCEYCGTDTDCSGVTQTICVKPLDYLDIQPSSINIKEVFDMVVLSNLIDVKSRQTISDYPLLRLFYQLYLTASNCGKDLTGRFTYNNMFEFMDKIGDYWLDLIEEVVPSTTIWEGCDNSGKIYRNTIFDQNKFKYKKYNMNYIDVDVDAPLSAQTNFNIASETIYSVVEQKPIYVTDKKIKKINNQIRTTTIQKDIILNQITDIETRICSLNLQDLDVDNSTIIFNLNLQKDKLLSSILSLDNTIIDLNNQKEELEVTISTQQENYTNNFMSCSGLSETLLMAQENLNNFTPNTIEYETQRDFIAAIKDKYNKCIKKSNKLISNYNTVFITQIYDTNEYEGNITILGDPDWEIGGPFYNKELIHNP